MKSRVGANDYRIKMGNQDRLSTYPLPYAMREELWNKVDSMLEMGVVRP